MLHTGPSGGASFGPLAQIVCVCVCVPSGRVLREWTLRSMCTRAAEAGAAPRQGWSEVGPRAAGSTNLGVGSSAPSVVEGPERRASSLRAPITTWMVRNIPVNYTQKMLVKEWPADGSYDFLYLPRSHDGPCHCGYAFINFVSEALALDFKRAWHRKNLTHADPAAKRLNIVAASVQGFEANGRQWGKRRVGRICQREWQPVLVRNGRRIGLTEV